MLQIPQASSAVSGVDDVMDVDCNSLPFDTQFVVDTEEVVSITPLKSSPRYVNYTFFNAYHYYLIGGLTLFFFSH
jgi:hypothetical protein